MFINPHHYSKESQQTPKQQYGFWEFGRRATIEGRKIESMSCSDYCKTRSDTKTQEAFKACIEDCDLVKRLSEWHRRN